MKRSIIAVGVLLTGVSPSALYAQEYSAGAQQNEVVSATRTAAQPSEIVVTAQKRDERLVDVPISITALSSDTLRDNGINSSRELGQVVPGLRLDSAGASTQPTIRGVGSALAGPGVGSAVAIYVDGIYQPNPIGNNFELTDIDSIQVLKGPQGTLFGRNATGGAIVITTSEPSFEPSLKGSFSYGRFNDVRATASVSSGITDKIAASLTGLYHYSDGFMKDVTTGRDMAITRSYAVRGKVLFEPSDKLKIVLSGLHLRNRDDNTVTYNARNGYSNARAYPVRYPNPIIPSKRGDISIDSPNYFYVEQTALTARADLDVGFADLVSYTGWQKMDSRQEIDFDASRVPYQDAQFSADGKSFSQEFNLVSNGSGPLQWVVGAYYFYDKSRQPDYQAAGLSVVDADPSLIVPVFSAEVETKSYAAFADATYELTDNLFATVGARYSIEESKRLFKLIQLGLAGPGDATFKSFTPRAVLRYNFSPSANVYASYSKGFKAGGFNPTSLSPDPFRPEKIDAFELGMKFSRPGLSASASTFYYDYKDLQVSSYILGAAVINNAAKSRIYGADAEVSAKLTDRLTVNLSAAYTNAKYKAFLGAPSYPGTGVQGDLVRTEAVNLYDARAQRAPKWTGSISATYEQPIGDDTLRLYASYYMTDDYNLEPTGMYVQDGYGLLSGRLTYALDGDRLSLSIYGNNLTDSKYLSQLLLLESAPLQQWAFPRTYGVEVGFKF